MRFRILLLWLILLLAECAGGATLTVRKDGTGDYMVIQQALDVAADGDTVLIGPGEYTESTMVRLPGWAYDIESFAHLRADNLTLVGEGADVTSIGPATYGASSVQWSPIGVTYDVGRASLHISELSVRNCNGGVYVVGTLYMDRCKMLNNALGLNWGPRGSGGWVRDCVFEVTTSISDPMAFSIGAGGLGSDIELERCIFGKPASIRTVQGITIRDCDLSGFSIYSASTVTVDGCRPIGTNAGISLGLGSGIYCEVRNSYLRGQVAALAVDVSAPGGRFVVENSRLEGGDYAVFYAAYNAGACAVHNCDLIRGTGPIVRCDSLGDPVTHDFSNNYWGTTRLVDIMTWIIDHNDDLSIGATVLYTPFAGQSVPTETTRWGDLKSLFR